MAQGPEECIDTAENSIVLRSTILVAATTGNEELAE